MTPHEEELERLAKLHHENMMKEVSERLAKAEAPKPKPLSETERAAEIALATGSMGPMIISQRPSQLTEDERQRMARLTPEQKLRLANEKLAKRGL